MKVGEISNQMQETGKKLKLYGHVVKRDEEYVGKILMRMDMDVEKERKTEAEVDGQWKC